LNDFDLVDIKIQNIDEKSLDFVAQKMGSYEALFSKRAMKYKSLGLDKIQLSEEDYKNWMLKEYTFLKRPFIIVNDQVFVGNSAKTVEAAKSMIHHN
jgi:arsenate reductase